MSAVRRGRPRIIDTVGVTSVRFTPDLEARVYAFADRRRIGRSEAIRQLIEAGLGARKNDSP